MEYVNFSSIEDDYSNSKYIYFNNTPINKYGISLYSYTIYYIGFSNYYNLDNYIVDKYGVDI